MPRRSRSGSGSWTTAALGALLLGLSGPVAAARPEPPAAQQQPAQRSPAQPVPGCPAPREGDRAAAAAAQKLLGALDKELQRFMQATAQRAEAPVHFAALRTTERRAVALTASLGGLLGDDTDAAPERVLDVSVRVGDRHVDSSHPLRGMESGTASGSGSALPLGEDERALRTAAWRALDDAYDMARQRYLKVRANAQVTTAPEDQSDDFSVEPPVTEIEPLPAPRWPDLGPWRQRLQRVSAQLRGDPEIVDSRVEMNAYQDRRYLITSAGTRVVTAGGLAMVSIGVDGLSVDGTHLSRHLVRYAPSIDELPGEADLLAWVRGLREEMHALRRAKILDPYSGPVLLEGRAAAVLFHEVLGHRLEGQRQRSDRESGTFARRLGQRVMPAFLSVTDDPGAGRLGREALNGCYRHDDEGVPASPVHLIEDGVLRAFLLGRQPARGFTRSNGHGRAGLGHQPVGRQANLIVTAAGALPAKTARARLLEEVRRSGRPYGLRVAEISGGFTSTGRGSVEGMKVLPETMYLVYADGRPDELVRGAHVIGTPLTVLEHVVAAFDDPAVFNGQCGAESGWVPVAAVAPSLLVDQMELARAPVEGQQAPLLPAPGGADSPGEVAGLAAELKRAAGLHLSGAKAPYFLALRGEYEDTWSLHAELGALLREGHGRARHLVPQVRVGDMHVDSAGLAADADHLWREPLVVNSLAERWDAWLGLDRAYKAAVEQLSRRQALEAEEPDTDPVDDFGPVRPLVWGKPVAVTGVPEATRALWRGRLERISQAGRLVAAAPAGVVLEGATSGLDAMSRQRTLVTSEGTQVITGARLASLWLAAAARAADGMPVRMNRRFFARALDELPAEPVLSAAAAQLSAEVLAVAGAPLLQNYDGPVLFEGEAAAQIMQALLGRFVADSRPPRQARGRSEGPLAGRLGRRVTAPALDLVDEPLLAAVPGVSGVLLGGYEMDDDGVPAERVRLIEKGVLVGLLSSRRPTRDMKRSNGHGRSFGLQRWPEAAPSNLVASVAEPLSAAALRARLLEEARAEHVAEPLIVRRLGVSGSKGMVPQVWVVSAVRLGPGGEERPVRGGALSYVAPRLLRGLVAASERRTVYTTLLDEDGDESRGGVPVTVVVPDLLLRDVEVQGVRGPFPRPRLLPPPQ